jgi:OOP family OmpA-OmpF porin
MNLKNLLALVIAAVFCVGTATLAAQWIEARSGEVVRDTLAAEQYEWTEIETDGLRVTLGGTAPDEATRFRVVTTVGRVIDPDRIVDEMEVAARSEIAAPRFSVEMLRNEQGVSLIGLVPASTDREELTAQIDSLPDTAEVTDMLESSSYTVPEGWDEALDYAMEALSGLPRSKISVTADFVEITAISDSPAEKRRIETELARSKPDGLRLALNISSPRPVIDGVAKFDACSAGSDRGRTQIITAAVAAGLQGKPECAIGLGIPSPTWPDAVVASIKGLTDLGGGTLTMSDGDISLVALDTTPQPVFDRVIGDVEAQLPELFSLHATLPKKVVIDGTGDAEAIPEFIATRSPEGLVQLRGRLGNAAEKSIVGSYARAQFGSGSVYLATRADDGLPNDWSVRVLAALQALAELESGSATVQPDFVEIRGVTGSQEADDKISQLLGDKLGGGANFELAIRYGELLDETLDIPEPQECVERINKILALSKITFEPSSSEISASASGTLDRIGEIVALCDRVRMEIGAHSDSQGRESMNLELSQERAQSVLQSLVDRRIRTRALSAKGYGEAVPIADNKTEDGREANRRIEFKLLTDARTAATEDTELPADAPLASDQPQDNNETPSE